MTADGRGTSVAALAAWGLQSSRDDRFGSTAPLAHNQWRALMGDAERHRLVGVLAAAVGAGDLAVTDVQHRELAGREETWHGHALAMEHLLIAVVDTLDDGDIPHRVIKGPALAHTVAADPAQRTFGDIDIVVPGVHLPEARRRLTEHLGADDLLPELRPGFDQRFAKDVVLRRGNVEIDLHRTVAAGPFGLRIPTDDLFEGASTFWIGGREIATLPPATMFLQTCYNAALGDVPHRLASVRDVAMVADRLAPRVDEVADLTRRWRAQAIVLHAVDLTWSTLELGDHPLADWARALTPSRRDGQLLATSRSERRSYTRQLAALSAVPGIAGKVRYAHGILRPSDAYLTARGWTRRSHLHRAVRTLARSRG